MKPLKPLKDGWLKREIEAAKRIVASWPEHKRWGAEIEAKDTAKENKR